MPITNPNYSDLNHEEMASAIGLKAKHIPLLVGSFLEEANPIVEKIKIAIENSDYKTIQSAAHSLKGSAGNLRFNELSEMAKEMEHAGAASDASFDYNAYLEAISQAIGTISA